MRERFIRCMMNDWLLTICAFSAVLMLVEGILSEGSTKKTVRFVLSLLFMLIILKPVINIIAEIA